MKCVVLCRVSSKEQEETGYSLSAQEKFLNNYREKQGFELTKLFSISESASGKKQREMFDQMIDYVEKENINIIICEKVDRLTRNFKDMVMIDEWLEQNETRQVHLVKDSLVMHKNSRSQEKLNWGIRILFAKNYVDNLSEEVKKGQKEKLSQGWLPKKPPYGYKTVGTQGHREHVIDESISPLIKRMFELYATGNYSLKKLEASMYDFGLRTPRGGKVAKSRINDLLRNPFYIGKNLWNKTLTDGKQEHLISIELFNKVQSVLDGKNTPKFRKHNFQFKGLIKCDECGGTITWETQKGIIYGHCNHYRKCSQKVWSKEKDVNEVVTSALKELKLDSPRLTEWVRKALKETHEVEIELHQSSQAELKQRYDQIEKRLDKLFDEKVDGNIEESFYKRKLAQYTEEKNDVLKSMKGQANSSDNFRNESLRIYEIAQDATSSYLSGDPDQRHELISHIFEKLTMREGKLEYRYSPDFQRLHKAVKATNSSKDIENVFDKVITFEPTKKLDESSFNGSNLSSYLTLRG